MRFRKGEITQKQNAVNHILKTIILVLIIPQMRIINNMWEGGYAMQFSYEKYETIRNKHELTDYAVGKGTGIAQSCFSDWKSGRSKPKLDKISMLANFLDCKIEDVIG